MLGINNLGTVGAAITIAPSVIGLVGKGVHAVVNTAEHGIESAVNGVVSGVANTVNAGVSAIEDGASKIGSIINIFA